MHIRRRCVSGCFRGVIPRNLCLFLRGREGGGSKSARGAATFPSARYGEATPSSCVLVRVPSAAFVSAGGETWDEPALTLEAQSTRSLRIRAPPKRAFWTTPHFTNTVTLRVARRKPNMRSKTTGVYSALRDEAQSVAVCLIREARSFGFRCIRKFEFFFFFHFLILRSHVSTTPMCKGSSNYQIFWGLTRRTYTWAMRRCNVGLRNNFDLPGSSIAHRNLDTRAFPFFAYTRKTAVAAGIEPASLSSATQRLRH